MDHMESRGSDHHESSPNPNETQSRPPSPDFNQQGQRESENKLNHSHKHAHGWSDDLEGSRTLTESHNEKDGHLSAGQARSEGGSPAKFSTSIPNDDEFQNQGQEREDYNHIQPSGPHGTEVVRLVTGSGRDGHVLAATNETGVNVEVAQRERLNEHKNLHPIQSVSHDTDGSLSDPDEHSGVTLGRSKEGSSREAGQLPEIREKQNSTCSVSSGHGEVNNSPKLGTSRSDTPKALSTGRPYPMAFVVDHLSEEDSEREGSHELGRSTHFHNATSSTTSRHDLGRTPWGVQPLIHSPVEESSNREWSLHGTPSSFSESGESGYSSRRGTPDSFSRAEYAARAHAELIARANEHISSRPAYNNRPYQARIPMQGQRMYSRPPPARRHDPGNQVPGESRSSSAGPSQNVPHYYPRAGVHGPERSWSRGGPARKSSGSVQPGTMPYKYVHFNHYAHHERREPYGIPSSPYHAKNAAAFITGYGDGDEVDYGRNGVKGPWSSQRSQPVPSYGRFRAESGLNARHNAEARYWEYPRTANFHGEQYDSDPRRDSFDRERPILRGPASRDRVQHNTYCRDSSDSDFHTRSFRRRPSRIYSSDESEVPVHRPHGPHLRRRSTDVDQQSEEQDSEPSGDVEPSQISNNPRQRPQREGQLVPYMARGHDSNSGSLGSSEHEGYSDHDGYSPYIPPQQPYHWMKNEIRDDSSQVSRSFDEVPIRMLRKESIPSIRSRVPAPTRKVFEAPVSYNNESQDITFQLSWNIKGTDSILVKELSLVPAGSIELPFIQIIRALVPELRSGGNGMDSVTINRCGASISGGANPVPDLTWLHLQQDTLSLQGLSEFVSTDARINEEYRIVALELLQKQCPHFERVILQGDMRHNVLQPGTVFRCDGPADPKRHEAAKSVIFCSIPFFEALEPPINRKPRRRRQGEHLIRSLEQQIYDFVPDDGHELEQIFRRTKIMRQPKEIICVPQVWFLVCGTVVISCGHLTQEQLCGKAVTVNEPSSAKIVASVQISGGQTFNAIFERSASYFVVLRTIREMWSTFENETLDQSDLVLSDGTTLSSSRWNQLIRENISWLRIEMQHKSSRSDPSKALALFQKHGAKRDFPRRNSYQNDGTSRHSRDQSTADPERRRVVVNDLHDKIPTTNRIYFGRLANIQRSQLGSRTAHFNEGSTGTNDDDLGEQEDYDVAETSGQDNFVAGLQDDNLPFLSWPIFDGPLQGDDSLKKVLDSIKADLSGDPNFAQRMSNAQKTTLADIRATQDKQLGPSAPEYNDEIPKKGSQLDGVALSNVPPPPLASNKGETTGKSTSISIHGKLRNKLAQGIDTMISLSASLILQFVPEENGHLLVLELWGNLQNIQKHATEILRGSPTAGNVQNHHYPRLHLEGNHAGLELLTASPSTSMLGCARCRRGFKSLAKGVKHLRKKHFDIISQSQLVKWLGNVSDISAIRVEVAATILIEFVHSLELVQIKTTRLQEGSGHDKECMTSLATAFSDIFIMFAYVSRKLAKIHNSSSLDELMPPRRQKDLSSYSKIRFLRESIVKSVNGAAHDIMISGLSNRSDGAFRLQPVEPHFLTLVIANSLFARQIRTTSEEDFDLIQMYHEEIARLQLQIKRRPMKRLYLDIATLDEELQALRKVYEGQLSFCRDMARVLAPDSFRVTTEKRCNSFVLEAQYLDKMIRRLKAREDEIEGIQARTRQLYKTLNYVLGIKEESNHNAIWVFTLVTVFFLPLSFVTSFFGMNLDDIRETEQTQWLFWAAAVPTTLVVLAFTYVYGYKWQDWKENGKESLKVMAEPWKEDMEEYEDTSRFSWIGRFRYRGRKDLPHDVEGRSGTFKIGENITRKPGYRLSQPR